MKHIILFSLILLFKFTSIAASNDTVCVKGYFLVQYSKNEIVAQKKNAQLKGKRKSHSIAIDYERKEIFIPSDSIHKSLKESLLEHTGFHQKTIYYIPSSPRSISYIEKLSERTIDRNVTLKYFEKNDQFYSLDHNDKNLYKIYYIEAFAVSLELDNNAKNLIVLDLTSDQVTKDKAFKTILTYCVKIVAKDFVHIDGFSIWEK